MIDARTVFSGSGRGSAVVIGALLALVVQAGCSQTDDLPAPAPERTEAVAPAAAPATTPASASASHPDITSSPEPTTGGDGSEIVLDALTEDDLTGTELSGELGCSFLTPASAPLLVAKGFVASDEPAQGVVKVAGHVERIAAPGGFSGIDGSPTFSGKGKTIRIAVTGEPVGNGESPPRPATLTYLRADGAVRTWSGHWQCGP